MYLKNIGGVYLWTVYKMFGINSNAVGYVISDDEPEGKLYSIFKDIKNKKSAAIAAEIFESYGTIRFVNMFPLVIKAIKNSLMDKTMGDVYMSATEVIKGILKDKNVTQVELAERTNVTKQNLSNKMNRDNFST